MKFKLKPAADDSHAKAALHSRQPVQIGKQRKIEVLPEFDGTINAPSWAAEIMEQAGYIPDDGEEKPGSIKDELSKCSSSELAVFLNSRDYDNYYFEAHEHSMAAEALAAGLPHIAEELDTLYQHFHRHVTKDVGQIKLVTTDPESRYDLRAFALALHDADAAGQPLPDCPWSAAERKKTRASRGKK